MFCAAFIWVFSEGGIFIPWLSKFREAGNHQILCNPCRYVQRNLSFAFSKIIRMIELKKNFIWPIIMTMLQATEGLIRIIKISSFVILRFAVGKLLSRKHELHCARFSPVSLKAPASKKLFSIFQAWQKMESALSLHLPRSRRRKNCPSKAHRSLHEDQSGMKMSPPLSVKSYGRSPSGVMAMKILSVILNFYSQNYNRLIRKSDFVFGYSERFLTLLFRMQITLLHL